MQYRVKLPLLLASAALLTGLLPARTVALQSSGETHEETAASFQRLPFEKLYVFGDSLSDTGNVFNASKQFLGTGSPPPPYYEGRFSNGLVWIDYLAQKLNLTPQPIVVLENPQTAQRNSSNSINFAYGGATTGTSSSLTAAIPGLQAQVREFKQRFTNQSADPQALFVIWMGANDYLSFVNRSGAAADPAVPVQNITSAIESLYQSGARHVLVANLPDLGETPLAKQQGNSVVQTLKQLSDRHNQLLSQRLDDLQRNLPDLDLMRLDIGKLYVNTADAQTFDLTNPCYDRATGTVCAQPDRHLFWDSLHPTTAAHREISENALALIDRQTAAQSTSLPGSLPIAGLSAIGTIGILAGAGAFWRHRRDRTRG